MRSSGSGFEEHKGCKVSQKQIRGAFAVSHPLIVLHIILEGARKWMGPFLGCVFILFRRKRSYLAFCLTSPPEMTVSSHLTITCRDSRCFKGNVVSHHCMQSNFTESLLFQMRSVMEQTHQLLPTQELLGCNRRQPPKHMPVGIDHYGLQGIHQLNTVTPLEDCVDIRIMDNAPSED